MFVFLFLLALVGAKAQDIIPGTNITIGVVPEDCKEYHNMKPHINPDIPEKCCHFSTKACFNGHNGRCRLLTDTADCDYTEDVCASDQGKWFCTCCGNCTDSIGQCYFAGGNCKRLCDHDEDPIQWVRCSSDQCQCCKNKCPKTCVSGVGTCVLNTQDCPQGFYHNSNDRCEGGRCKCCHREVECTDSTCESGDGYCINKQKSCPPDYHEDSSDKCPNTERCKCCKKNNPSCCEKTCSPGGNQKCISNSEICPSGTIGQSTNNCGLGCKCCQEIGSDCKHQRRCANGTAMCMTGPKCPDKYYLVQESQCKGDNCICCRPCNRNERCEHNDGYCGAICPNGVHDCDDCEKPCECCKNEKSGDGSSVDDFHRYLKVRNNIDIEFGG